MSPKELFVYGTLRAGLENRSARLLPESASLSGAAKVRGRLFLIAGYPGAVASAAESEWVFGEVWTLRQPAETLRALDEYEGCGPLSPEPHEFTRARTLAYADSGILTAWIYWYNFDPNGKPLIRGGDFAKLKR